MGFCLEKGKFRESKSFFCFPEKSIGKIKPNFLEVCCHVNEALSTSCKKEISGCTFSHEESLYKVFLLFG